jgi:serine/threonine protein kinase
MQRYGAAAAAPSSGRAIGELAAHHRLGAHPAVLPLIEAMADERCIYMVFPYADGPDAFDAVAATPRGLPEADARRYFVDMALGVLHLKTHGVSHGLVSGMCDCLQWALTA